MHHSIQKTSYTDRPTRFWISNEIFSSKKLQIFQFNLLIEYT